MNELIDKLINLFNLIFDFVLKALVAWWDLITSAIEKAAFYLFEHLLEIIPESQQTLSAGIMDYFECLNYYFPVKETFTILVIYLQFRIALFVVRTTVKIMTAGQF